MNARTGWFIAGLVMLALAALYAPKIAGYVVVLIVLYLGFKVANKGLI